MRTVLITGGSRGIGAATARLFAAQGDRVFINYQKDEANAKTLCKEIGATALKGDVASPADVDRMFQSMPGIDVLVNNAGFAQFQFFDALTDEDWQRMLAVTLSGAFYCIRRAPQFAITEYTSRKAPSPVSLGANHVVGQVGSVR